MKKAFYILLLLGLAGIFYSCSDNDDPSPKPQPLRENIAFNIDNKYIRAGEKADGEIIFNIDNKYIRVGVDSTQTLSFRIEKGISTDYICPYMSERPIFSVSKGNSSDFVYVGSGAL